MKDMNDELTLDWLGEQPECLGLEQQYLALIEQAKPQDIVINLIEVIEEQLELF